MNRFRTQADQKEFIGERESGTGRALYIARPIRITNAACLSLPQHGRGGAAHGDRKYGPANGFGWHLNEVIGAQVVSVPMSVPLARRTDVQDLH